MSKSTNRWYPSSMYYFAFLMASCALRLGRKPKLKGENPRSKTSVSLCRKACWISRSITVGILNNLFPPFCLCGAPGWKRMRPVLVVSPKFRKRKSKRWSKPLCRQRLPMQRTGVREPWQKLKA